MKSLLNYLGPSFVLLSYMPKEAVAELQNFLIVGADSATHYFYGFNDAYISEEKGLSFLSDSNATVLARDYPMTQAILEEIATICQILVTKTPDMATQNSSAVGAAFQYPVAILARNSTATPDEPLEKAICELFNPPNDSAMPWIVIGGILLGLVVISTLVYCLFNSYRQENSCMSRLFSKPKTGEAENGLLANDIKEESYGAISDEREKESSSICASLAKLCLRN